MTGTPGVEKPLLGLYKPGQGKWARGVAAVGLAAMGLWAAIQTHDWMIDARWNLGYIVPGVILLGFLWAAWYVANRPGVTDFIIETEVEMKKVTWPTAREVANATIVVIIVMFVLMGFLWVVDLGWGSLFKLIGIL